MRRLVSAVLVALVLFASPAGAVQGGEVHPRQGVADHGDTAALDLARPVVGFAATPSGGGYWQVASDGGIFRFGDAAFFGSTGAMRLNQPIVGMAPTPTGRGYWLVATDGGIFSFGDAVFHGSTGAIRLNQPIVGMAPTPTGRGYWLVATDGGIFRFGDAAFHGSTGAMRLASPIVAMAPTPTGRGYWLLASDGGVFTFGDAVFHGSAAGRLGPEWAVGILPSPTGGGYRIAASDGYLFGFGDAPAEAGASAACKAGPIVAASGGWLTTSAFRTVAAATSAHPLDVLTLESRNLAEVLRHRQDCQPDATPRGGRLRHPLPGSVVSSSYGRRTHPIYNRPQDHDGVDLAGGSDIRAAGDGTVVQVSTRTGYGTTTVIDHGDGVGTVYAHQSRVAVRAGQRVSAGQVIGTVGSTGFATGPHLHFEVRVHGQPTEPLQWL